MNNQIRPSGEQPRSASRTSHVYGAIKTTVANSSYTFGYDADGGRVRQGDPAGYQTAYVGNYEETLAPTTAFAQDFNAGAGSWTTSGGSWSSSSGYYRQTATTAGESASVIQPAVTFGDFMATVSVRVENVPTNTHALAGLVLRRDTRNAPAYFVGVRNSASGYYCGVYEKSGSTWTNRSGQLTACRVTAGTWYTLLVRAAGGRLEMYLNGALIATWVDTTPLAAYGFGLMTIDGAASFDDVKVYGLSTRSYYMFGSARVAERVTTLAKTAAAGDLYALHADHLGSVSLATDAWGVTVTASLARFFPFGAERGAAPSGSPTDYAYTGGRSTPSLGLVHLGARWYDSYLNQWTQPDSIIPDAGDPQSYNRYSYALSNPLKYVDPSGHVVACGAEACGGGTDNEEEIWDVFVKYGNDGGRLAEYYALVHVAERALADHDPYADAIVATAMDAYRRANNAADQENFIFAATFPGAWNASAELLLGTSKDAAGNTVFGAIDQPFVQAENVDVNTAPAEGSGAATTRYASQVEDHLSQPTQKLSAQIRSLRSQLEVDPSNGSWQQVSSAAEPSISFKGGISVEEQWVNAEGATLYRHTIYDADGLLVHETFRPYPKMPHP